MPFRDRSSRVGLKSLAQFAGLPGGAAGHVEIPLGFRIRIANHPPASPWEKILSARDETRASLRKVRNLLTELGLVNPVSKRLWKAKKIWQDD